MSGAGAGAAASEAQMDGRSGGTFWASGALSCPGPLSSGLLWEEEGERHVLARSACPRLSGRAS